MSEALELPRWREAVCIASGPSLTREDCELVKVWRDTGDGRGIIVVNSAFMFAPWADMIYALDVKWWNVYTDKVPASMIKVSHKYDGAFKPDSMDTVNSGSNAIALAHATGASRITLIGYDLQLTGGKSHCHGDHPPVLGNCKNIATWPERFARVAMLKNCQIINASRETALAFFPRMRLEHCLTT